MAVAAIAFGVDEACLNMIKAALPLATFKEMPMEINSLLQPLSDFKADIIFCGRVHANISIVDVAQGVRSMYAEIPMYYASSERHGFDRKELLKNGFADAFLMPMDLAILKDLITDGTKDFKNVPLIDIKPGTVLDFDTYVMLPMNRKYIRFSRAGRALEADRAKRLVDHHVSSVAVQRTQMETFYKFTAEQLRKMEVDPAISETERRDRMHAAVRSLLTGFLSDDTEIADCSQIVKSYILERHGDEKNSWYEKMMALSGTGTGAYEHVSTVSTLASMFAIGLGLGSPEEVALAGLLHDIGMADVPGEAQTTPEAERSHEQRLQYESHPKLSLEILKSRQLNLPENVYKIIEQHHERFDGGGYPNGVKGADLLPEAQLLSIADEFHYRSHVEPGKQRPKVREIMTELLSSPAYDPALCARITDLIK